MVDTKQILVIDDHFEMLEFLRSMLEMSDDGYQVLGVPSAEEGYFELRQTPFDLLITDVRLPGMSGFDLVRRVRKVHPDLPIIMITAYSSAQGKQEAGELGVFRYFQKPLDTNALLAAVHVSLYGEGMRQPVRPKPVAAEPRLEPPFASEKIRSRIQLLRTDTGAAQVALANIDGTILVQVGRDQGVDLQGVAEIVARTMQNSFELGGHLRVNRPFSIQYQAGDRVDLYSANVGHDHFLLLLFDVQARRGRIGTIWIFTQRAINDLEGLLPASKMKESGKGKDQKSRPGSGTTVRAGNGRPVRHEERTTPEQPPAPAAAETEHPGELALDEVTENQPEQTNPDTDKPAVDEAAEDLLAVFGADGDASSVDLDAFWESALSGSEADPDSINGLSFDEAIRRGLLPPDFDLPGE